VTRRPKIALRIIVATIGALLVIVFWALRPLLSAGSFWGPNDASIVHRYFPVHIVPPEWVHSTSDDFRMDWIFIETKVRISMVASLWVFAIILTFDFAAVRTPNRPSHAMAVDSPVSPQESSM
jgi:hypothetical protein